MNVKILSYKNQIGFEFRATTNTQIPLTKYIETGKDANGSYMVILPNTDQGQALLSEMSSIDVLRIRGIFELLAARIRNQIVERTERSMQIDTTYWLNIIRQLSDIFEYFKSCLIFKQASLKEAHKREGYEHLWLKLEDVNFEDRHFSEISFKLVAKNIKPDQFTDFGSLVFREQENGVSPFESWPPQKSDQFGPVLILDYPVETNEDQLVVMNSLTKSDKKFINVLLGKLTSILTNLEITGIQLERPVAQWQHLVNIMLERAKTIS